MEFFVDFFEMRVGDVSVDLGGADIGVTKHCLDRANIGAIHEQIGGKTVTQSMWGNMFGDPGHLCVFLDHALD